MKNISFETAALMSAVLLTGNSVVRRNAARTATVLPPTPEQLARRERTDWNKAVEAKKAAKRRAKEAALDEAHEIDSAAIATSTSKK